MTPLLRLFKCLDKVSVMTVVTIPSFCYRDFHILHNVEDATYISYW